MNIIGHEEVRRRFNNGITKNALSHAHLIVGEDGIGKSFVAEEFAHKLIGVKDVKTHVDIIKYKSEKASFGVEAVRDIITESNKKPYEGDKKVIIIYQGEKLTIQAQNALLKTIEEPPSGVFIILLTESSELILDTIKSRCQIHKLSPLNKEEMINFINSNYSDIDKNLINTLISFSEGIPGRVEKFLNDEEFNKIREKVIELLGEINTRNSSITIKYADEFFSMKGKENEILTIILTFIRDIMIYKEIKNTLSIINGDKLEDIEKISNGISYKKLKGIVNIVDEARKNIKSNTNSWITFNTMLINILEE